MIEMCWTWTWTLVGPPLSIRYYWGKYVCTSSCGWMNRSMDWSWDIEQCRWIIQDPTIIILTIQQHMKRIRQNEAKDDEEEETRRNVRIPHHCDWGIAYARFHLSEEKIHMNSYDSAYIACVYYIEIQCRRIFMEFQWFNRLIFSCEPTATTQEFVITLHNITQETRTRKKLRERETEWRLFGGSVGIHERKRSKE